MAVSWLIQNLSCSASRCQLVLKPHDWSAQIRCSAYSDQVFALVCLFELFSLVCLFGQLSQVGLFGLFHLFKPFGMFRLFFHVRSV